MDKSLYVYAKQAEYIKKYQQNLTLAEKNEGDKRWLYENIYIVMQEVYFALNELRGNSGIAFDIAKECISNFEYDISLENLGAILKSDKYKNVLKYETISKILLCLRLELCYRLYRLCRGKEKCSFKDIIIAYRKLCDIEQKDVLSFWEVERVLEKDPENVYSSMTDASKDYYRKKVAELADKNNISQLEQAKKVLNEAQKNNVHLGKILFKKEKNIAGYIYLFLLTFFTVALSSVLTAFLGRWWSFFLFVIPVSEIVKKILDFSYYKFRKIRPCFVIKLKEIPDNALTAVVISCLVTSKKDIEKLITRIKKLNCTNGGKNVLFGLLVDFKDSNLKVEKGDEELKQTLKKEIEELKNDCFFCVVRNRSYNPKEKIFMGFERKRGAICELVSYIYQGKKINGDIFGNQERLRKIKYITALDSDTNLPIQEIKTLVGAMLHPSNKAEIDEKKGIVKNGYGIIVTRLSADLASSQKNLFSKIYAGFGGSETYSNPTYDLYYDIFEESIFSGKGILDVEAFYKTAIKKIPHNKILSHDLLEGFFMRTGFVGEVAMTDSFPSSVFAYYKRAHRWYRGDVQSLIFLFKKVVNSKGEKELSGISSINKFKLLDNIRRMLLIRANLQLLLWGFFSPICFAVGIISLFSGQIISLVDTVVHGGLEAIKIRYSSKTISVFKSVFLSALFDLIFLPYAALVSFHAFYVALIRMLITKKKLLVWITAAQSDKRKDTLLSYYKGMIICPVFALVFILTLKIHLIVIGVGFALAPLAAYLISKPTPEQIRKIPAEKQEKLMEYAKDIYSYFADFVNQENNFLPPDNLQEQPVYRQAKRTSPTNIGMSLIAHVSAHILGIITFESLVSKIENTIETIKKAEKYRGHLYNWYSTEDLKPLEPRYISTVDSGNLACSLCLLYSYLSKNKAKESLLNDIKNIENEMDFDFLYNKKKKLFYIGVDSEGKTGDNCYDLFMSEYRMTGYYLIAKGKVGKKHWSALNRLFIGYRGYFGLKSWSGTMFEYMMPNLFLPCYSGSLIWEATHFAINEQKKYHRPYGISESGFYAFDNELSYQYRAFGVPKLALDKYRQGERVISPYSTFLTVAIQPFSALHNLERLKKLGVYGKYGFFEAVDFTKNRANGQFAIVKSYMAHHLGMSICAICNALCDDALVKIFMSDLQMNSFEELLCEKVPARISLYNEKQDFRIPDMKLLPVSVVSREISMNNQRASVISNGSMNAVVSDNGCCIIKYGGVGVLKYRRDNFKMPQGVFAFIIDKNKKYSVTSPPFFDTNQNYKATLSESRAVYYLNTQNFDATMVSTLHKSQPAAIFELSVEMKKNQDISFAFYLEPILTAFESELSHPAFSALFTCCQYDERDFVIFTRRTRTPEDKEIWLAAGVLSSDSELKYETMRENILPRMEGLSDIDLRENSFKGVAPSPVNPCLCILGKMKPQKNKASAVLLLCCGKTKEQAQEMFLNLKNEKTSLMSQALPPFSTLSQRKQETALKILPKLYYNTNPIIQPPERSYGLDTLWQYGISGDIPIICTSINKQEDLKALRTPIDIYVYFRKKGVNCDLVIFYDEKQGYDRPLYNGINAQINQIRISGYRSKGDIYTVNLPVQERRFLLRMSVFSFEEKDESFSQNKFLPFRLSYGESEPNREALFNQTQIGGFSQKEYKITNKRHWSFRPPYCAIIANKNFGTLVSDSSLGFTFALNARENKLTPWSNDTVYDNSGERLFLRCHGKIYDICREGHTVIRPDKAIFEAKLDFAEIKVTVTVDGIKPCKYVDVEIKNNSQRMENIELCFYCEPILSSQTRHGAIATENINGVWSARNIVNNGYGGIMFLYCKDSTYGTDNRRKFLQGIWNALTKKPCENCLAVGVEKQLNSEQSFKTSFILGYAKSKEAIENCIKEERIENKFDRKFIIDTPDEELNLFYNNFLQKQILYSRLFAKTGFYQCGGAFGFRDQLQDAICISSIYPEILKLQILRCCSVQFEEGDVMHWWHEYCESTKIIKGVRTRCSDDLLWLPYALCEYIEKTGDKTILDKKIFYLKADELKKGVNEAYITPEKSQIKENVYEHAVRAFKKGLNYGENGLILIGSGDWNDGFNNVGAQGKGTSVWLSQFVVLVAERLKKLCIELADSETAKLCKTTAQALRKNIEDVAFDSGYYIRGFFDNGDPLGSQNSDECKIDALPQSFASIIGLEKDRVKSALENAVKELVDEENGIISLFVPPFDNSKNNPGYIKSYIPGIRENAGQYTHAALWLVLGLIKDKQTDKAYELLKMINPLSHARNSHTAKKYLTEPYALSADIYTAQGLKGRGGWSHYTGSAGWFFKIVTEEIMGVTLKNGEYTFNPKYPSQWDNKASIKIEEN